MAHRIIIERLEFQGCCGVAPEERRRPQPLAIDLELEFEGGSGDVSDNIHEVVDYAQVAERIVELGTTQECALLETFAERTLTMLFTEFPIDRVKLWLRKLAPPLPFVTGSVGVQLDRTRMAHPLQPVETAPARFLTSNCTGCRRVACSTSRQAPGAMLFIWLHMAFRSMRSTAMKSGWPSSQQRRNNGTFRT
jgi:dihydroneopterin aldolase